MHAWRADDSGVLLAVSGGDPLSLQGPITLCARSATDPTRHFDGQLASFGIWNEGLTAQYIGSLYSQVSLEGAAAGESIAVAGLDWVEVA